MCLLRKIRYEKKARDRVRTAKRPMLRRMIILVGACDGARPIRRTPNDACRWQKLFGKK